MSHDAVTDQFVRNMLAIKLRLRGNFGDDAILAITGRTYEQATLSLEPPHDDKYNMFGKLRLAIKNDVPEDTLRLLNELEHETQRRPWRKLAYRCLELSYDDDFIHTYLDIPYHEIKRLRAWEAVLDSGENTVSEAANFLLREVSERGRKMATLEIARRLFLTGMPMKDITAAVQMTEEELDMAGIFMEDWSQTAPGSELEFRDV